MCFFDDNFRGEQNIKKYTWDASNCVIFQNTIFILIIQIQFDLSYCFLVSLLSRSTFFFSIHPFFSSPLINTYLGFQLSLLVWNNGCHSECNDKYKRVLPTARANEFFFSMPRSVFFSLCFCFLFDSSHCVKSLLMILLVLTQTQCINLCLRFFFFEE